MILETVDDFLTILQAGPIGPKLLAMKFIETYVLCFTLDSNEFETCNPEGKSTLIIWKALHVVFFFNFVPFFLFFSFINYTLPIILCL